MFLRNIINIGSLDLDFINKYYAVIADVIDFSNLLEMPLKYVDANIIINEIFNSINYEVFNYIKDQINQGTRKFPKRIKRKLLQICDNRIQEFSPSLNCCDSRFRNELDNVDVSGQEIPEIVDKVIVKILNSI